MLGQFFTGSREKVSGKGDLVGEQSSAERLVRDAAELPSPAYEF